MNEAAVIHTDLFKSAISPLDQLNAFRELVDARKADPTIVYAELLGGLVVAKLNNHGYWLMMLAKEV